MILKKKLIYIDQLVGPTSLDIINALTRYYEVHLYYGGIIKTYAELSPSVKLHKRPAYSKKSFLARFVSWLAFYCTTIPFILCKWWKGDFFFVSNPPLNFYIGYLFHRVFRIKFSLLLWDIYPDIIVQSNFVSEDSFIARKWSKWNTNTFPKAHRIFTVSESLSREIQKYENGQASHVVVVPNWVNADEIRPIARQDNLFIKSHQLHDDFIVMYSGNMGKTHDLETIVETARILQDQPGIRFVLIGDGEKKSKIVKTVMEGKIHNITILPFQDPEMFKSSIASAHIGFVTLAEGFENYSVPSKTYYLMAAGCIIFAIAGKGCELELIVDKYHCGYRFNPGSAVVIAEEILRLYNDRSLQQGMSANARKAAANFTPDNARIIAHEVYASS